MKTKLLLASFMLTTVSPEPLPVPEFSAPSLLQAKGLFQQEVCFSPAGHCEKKLLSFIESAQSSIDLAVFDLNLSQVVEALIQASEKLPVRIIVDQRQAHGPHSLVFQLVNASLEESKNLQVRWGKQRGLMHDKFIIVDGARIETGSFNYTKNASFNNQENQIYLGNPLVVERFKLQFEQMWQEKSKPATLLKKKFQIKKTRSEKIGNLFESEISSDHLRKKCVTTIVKKREPSLLIFFNGQSIGERK